MRCPLHIWLVFAACAVLALGAMSWLSVEVLRLEARQDEARATAALEENVRLALWRMESALSPIVAAESARPYFAYSPFHPAERAYTCMFAEIGKGEVLMPSPLLEGPPRFILVHFQFGPGGALSSPQVPAGNMRDLAEQGYVTAEAIEPYEIRLGQLREALPMEALASLLPGPTEPPPAAFGALSSGQRDRRQPRSQQRYLANNEGYQSDLNVAEYRTRSNWNLINSFQGQQSAEGPELGPQADAHANRPPGWRPPPPVEIGPMRPQWTQAGLVLARRVTVGGSEYVQGCLLDWEVVHGWLILQVRDLLPEARLEPVRTAALQDPARVLAAIPARLLPGGIINDDAGRPSPLTVSLAVAWICAIAAAAAVGALLVGAMRLSERRGAFVSSVTHELRTPLTSLQMYAEMLDEGMVTDQQKRSAYLGTIRTEADRLGHLVENVLSYARIEGGRGESRIEALSVEDIVKRCAERLTKRARQAGMRLAVDEGDASGVIAKADTGAVEQILFNLVDNACKYAASAEDRSIHVSCASERGLAVLRVTDHGPGIPAAEASKIFRPFAKSAKDAANSAPGVGLGLSLSRRLAREMGGDLRLEASSDGACFALSLPSA